MQGKKCVLLLVIFLSSLCFSPSVSAEDIDGIEANSVNILPSQPVEGGSITIQLGLQNTNGEEKRVEYAIYRDQISPSFRLVKNVIEIPANSLVEVNTTWSGLTAGEKTIWVEFGLENGLLADFSQSFSVQSLPDLEVTSVTFEPQNGAKSGEQVNFSATISNGGEFDAESSQVSLLVDQQSIFVPVPPVTSQNSVVVQGSFLAPSSGQWNLIFTADVEDDIVESDESNDFEIQYTVDSRVDFYHVGGLSVIAVNESLTGPWVYSGLLGMADGVGDYNVTLQLSTTTPGGAVITSPPFVVEISAAVKSWEHTVAISDFNLPVGVHDPEVIINPFGTDAYIQENTTNDKVSTSIEILEIPDVVLDPSAILMSPIVNSGDLVDWNVVIRNTGQTGVSGIIKYVWTSQDVEINQESSTIYLSAASEISWSPSIDLRTEPGKHVANFEATWIPEADSYDAIFSNSKATGSVEVEAPLRLTWVESSIALKDANGETYNGPLSEGDQYKLIIQLNTFATGSINYTCANNRAQVFEIITLTASDDDGDGQDQVTLVCTFTADAPTTMIQLVPEDPLASSVFTRSWSTTADLTDVVQSQDDNSFGTVLIIIVIILLLVGVLIAAIILTRESSEEVERDIFDYCPACDGELEGDEDKCPHCDFNLKKARSKFHDCEECGEFVPDLLENCPYCGAQQDVSKYFKRREKIVREKETVALPEESEDEEDEEVVVLGTEDFDEAVKEFGFDADQLESDWDENLAEAETQVEDAYDRQQELIEQQELDDEELTEIVEPTLKKASDSFSGVDLDEVLGQREDIKPHLADDDEELSASDAKIRERLYEITGEEGVLPGDEVIVGMGMSDRTIAGNEVPDDAMDFSFSDDSSPPPTKEPAQEEEKSRRSPRRRAPKRKETSADEVAEPVKMIECGVCGSEVKETDTECASCGARFE